MADQAQACPLCGALDGHRIEVAARRYHRCHVCQTVQLDPRQRLDAVAERAEYDRHQNDPADLRYRAFLARSLNELQARFAPGARGLDFGCGPGPALVTMAREAGYRMDAYDPFYRPDETVFEQRYDFITCTEVVEHLFAPCAVFDQLWHMLLPGGALVIQTQRVLDDARFRNWNYRRDPTHVVFFSAASFAWLAARWGASLALPQRDVAVLEKRA